VCIQNAINRTTSNIIRDDIAPGFDNSILDMEFIEYIQNFEIHNTPRINQILNGFKGNIIKINNYEELEDFYNSILN